MSGINARSAASYGCEIIATGYAFPSEHVDDATCLERCRFPAPDDVEAAMRASGIHTRTWCTDKENTWTMARDALDQILGHTPELKEEIDVVVVASGTTMPVLHPPDPNDAGMADLAPLVLQHLGRDDALGIDIKACYCTGFLRGLQTMDALLANPNYRAGLVIATEQGSPFAVAETNRSAFCYIMSDAAGAAVIRRVEPGAKNVGLVDHVGVTEASKLPWVGIGPDGVSTIMRGSRAGEATVALLVAQARTLLARNDLSWGDIDWFLPIQTHQVIVEGARAALECPPEKLIWFGDRKGFSGSASIPSSLALHLEEGVIGKGDLVLSAAVGAGLSGAATLFYV